VKNNGVITSYTNLNSIVFNSNNITIDYSKEIVGQNNLFTTTNSTTGDFNLFNSNATFNGVSFNTLYINILNNNFLLTSFKPQTTQSTLCFKEGSKILTNKGYVPVELLRKGDLIKTYLHDYLPIHLIGKSTIYNSGDSERIKDRLYTLPKSELPLLSEDLILTGCHSLLVDGLYHGQMIDMAGSSSGRLYKTDDKLRLFTCFEPKAIPYPEEGNFTIYHFALESQDTHINFGVWANGLLVETSSILGLYELSGMEFIE
jgi:hypothetical protein